MFTDHKKQRSNAANFLSMLSGLWHMTHLHPPTVPSASAFSFARDHKGFQLLALRATPKLPGRFLCILQHVAAVIGEVVVLPLLIGPQSRVGVCSARRGLDDLRAQRLRCDLARGRCNCGLSAPRAFDTPMHCGTDE
eukprot:15452314-Alexandrium_andersonii.AAC.2